MLNFSRLGAVRALFFKSEQYQLIEMPVHVGQSIDKHGRIKAAHTRIQRVRVEKPPVQHSLFGDDDTPRKDKYSARLDAFIRKHGGLGNLAHLMGGMTEGQQQRIFEEMGKLGGKTVAEVSAMFDGVKPETPAQADLFSRPDAVVESRKDLIEEHERLVHVLETPSHADDKVEAKKQAAELKEYKEAPKVSDDTPYLVEYTTRKGKVLRGVVRKDLTLAEAKEIDPYTFKHEGGYFIREKHLSNETAPKVFSEEQKITPVFAENPQISVGNAPASQNKEPFGVQPGITKKERIALNQQAVAIINRGSPFSDEDKAILRQYSGNGGCGDSLNEFYTLPEVASAMWSVAQKLGVKGNVLEPSCGPGVFLHTAPAGATVTGIEMDATSAKIAKALHGDRHEISNASLERFATQDNRQFNAVIGNVPFGLRGGLIKDDKPKLKTAEAYFCDTAMDKCKPGGVVGLIVPTGVMDSVTNRKLRESLLRKGQFIGAQRMPNTAFEHSHTGVTTDVIWFRKYPDDVAGALSSSAVTQDHLKAMGLWDEELLSGKYFTTRGAHNVLGKMEAGWRAKAGMGADITVEGSMQGVPEAIGEFAPEIHDRVPAVTDILAAVGDDQKAKASVLGGAMNRPYADKSKPGDTKTVDGIAYVLQGRPPRWHRVDEVLQSEALTHGQDIAGRIDALIAGSADVDRARLESDLRAWVEEHGQPGRHKDILLAAQQDKTLYRLIGAVKSSGELSDAVLGKVASRLVGNFEATVQSLLNDHETAAVKQIAKSAGIHEEEALDQLYASSKYAIDPATGEWTTSDIYLSGDLWARLDAASAALAGELDADTRKKLEGQARALNDAIAPVPLEDAFIETNSAFIPTSILSAFLTWRNHEGPDASNWTKALDPTVVTFADGVYTITGGNHWGINKILDKYLNRTGLRKDDKPAIDELNVAFKEWLCASPHREEIEDLYNRRFRGYAEREFSNEPMDIPGMNTDGLKAYQWGGLRWALNAGKGIIAADVGVGKTARGLMLAATLKIAGRAKRPLIVVPKSVLANWFAECEKWFPGSKVLTIGGNFERLADGTLKGKDDSAAERKRKYHDLQQNEYDFIIISEPSFEELDLDPVTKGEYNAKDFWVQRGDKLGNAGDKRTNKIREAWNQARAGQEFREGDRTDATYFNALGVDAVIADEMHHAKNLVSVRSRFGESPKYLGGSGLSMRSLDFNLKARWLLDQNDGRNVYGLSATPFKNSPLEIYAMISHVAPEAFERIGIRNSEEFLDRFARFEDGMALDTAGKMEEALITAGFQNMNELRTIMQRYIHRTTAADVGLKLPERQDVQHMIQMDDAQQAKYAELRELAAEAGGKDATGDSHIFSIMDKMNKAATDMSLLDSSYDAAKSPKYVACAAEIIKRMKDGGQIVFSDYVDSHEKIAEALVKSGIPRNQIGILNARAASSSAKRQQIADAFNAGKLKVVIGNTAVMGEGINLQKGTADIHHLDLPWEPASMQQRNGRGLRQGNTNLGVRIHSYLARGSFDGYRLQAIMAKKDWQDAVWNGDNEVENLNRQEINRDELMIMLAADPDQAREAYETNAKAREERFAAGKTAEASQRFVRFQETRRSYGALKNKDTQSAQRLKAKLDKEYAGLKADRYFTAKEALDMDQVVVHSSGALLHSGAGIEVEGERYVVTGADPRRGRISLRSYADETGRSKRTLDASDLQTPRPFAYDEKQEQAEIAEKVASKPLEIRSMDDVWRMPENAVEANREKIQQHLWDGARNYKVSMSGKIPLIEKSTGKPVMVDHYVIAGKGGNYTEATHDFLLPGPGMHAKALEAWKQAERDAEFGTYSTQARRGGKTSTIARRTYGGITEHRNPWGDIVRRLSGKDTPGYYGAEQDHPAMKDVRQAFHAEQMERMRRAPTFAAALEEAKPTGEIMDADKGYSALVKYPKKVLATLWARARHDGLLGQIMKESGAGVSTYQTNHTQNMSVHAALLRMAADAGHDDLVHAIADAGLRHHGGGNHKEALSAIAGGFGHTPDRIEAMRKLADKTGILDTPSGDLGAGYGALAAPGGYYSTPEEKRRTVRAKLDEMMQRAQKGKVA